MCFYPFPFRKNKNRRTGRASYTNFGRGQAIREEGGSPSSACALCMIAFFFFFSFPEQLQMMNAG